MLIRMSLCLVFAVSLSAWTPARAQMSTYDTRYDDPNLVADANDPNWTYDTGSDRQDRGRRGPRHEPFLINDRIIDLAINRITEGMVGHYNLDEDQLWQTRELWKDRFPQFFLENRREIVPIMNQYVEALLGDEPPTPEQVAEWADRFQPLFNEFSDLFEQTADDMKGYMTEEQQLILDGEMAVWNVAKNHMQGRIETWRQGGYDWKYEWPRSEDFIEQQREREQQLEAEALRAKMIALGKDPNSAVGRAGTETANAAGDADQAKKPTEAKKDGGVEDEWVQYVEDFIKRYQLTEAQENAARRILDSLKSQRDQYLERRYDDIMRLEKMYAEAESDEARAKARDLYVRLNEPLERYFQQLKDRLDRLPTRKQRAEAAQRASQTGGD